MTDQIKRINLGLPPYFRWWKLQRTIENARHSLWLWCVRKLNVWEIEHITSSAIWFDDGRNDYVYQPINIKSGFVVTGYRHHNCWTTKSIVSGKRLKPSEVWAIPMDNNNDRRTNISLSGKKPVQGFITSKFRFVDRRIGAMIAYRSGQIIDSNNTQLFSEDVWKNIEYLQD